MRPIFIKNLAFFFIACLCNSVFAQDEHYEDLDALANQMFEDMNDRDYDALIDMTHPKVFELVSKEQMKMVIKSMFEGNEEFSIEVPRVLPKYKISEVFKTKNDNSKYAFLSYDLKMSMTFHNEEFDDEAKKMMTSMMKAKGMDVKFVSSNTMALDMKDRITVLVNDELTNNEWTMVNYDPDSPLSYKILSSEILESAKNYNQDLMLARKKTTETKN